MINCINCGKEINGYPMWMTTLRSQEVQCSQECLKDYLQKVNIWISRNDKIKIFKNAPVEFEGSWKIILKGKKKC